MCKTVARIKLLNDDVSRAEEEVQGVLDVCGFQHYSLVSLGIILNALYFVKSEAWVLR